MNGAAYCVTYQNMKDWLRRGGGLPEVRSYPGNPELTKPVMLISFTFAPAPVLWSDDRGMDENRMPRWGRMILRIADHQPFKAADGSQLELALAKYTVDIHRQVDA
jgi:hypothetical protein